MALAVTEAEPKKAIHFASRYLDSDASHSQSDFCGAQELVRSINEEKRLRPTPSALVVEDDPDIALALQDLLNSKGFMSIVHRPVAKLSPRSQRTPTMWSFLILGYLMETAAPF